MTLTSEQLRAILMFASLHGSTNDLYYTAYVRLNDSLANKSSKFDATTVRAAALIAFNAEQLLFLVLPTTSLALVARPLLPVPTRRVLDAANALITASLPMGRFVSFVPQTPLSWPMSVLLPLLQHLLSLVTLSRSIMLF